MACRPTVVSPLVAAVLVLVPPAAAWDDATTVSGTHTAVTDVRGMVVPSGDVVAVWSHRDERSAGVAMARRRPGAFFGLPRELGTMDTRTGAWTGAAGALSDVGVYEPDRVAAVAVRPGRRHGSALEVWEGAAGGGRLRRTARIADNPWESGRLAVEAGGGAVATWTWMQPRRGAGSNLRPRVVMVARRSRAGARWSSPRRISPLPPGPPYGGGRGADLSATAATVARDGRFAVVAWQRRGRIEARISQDGARTFGPVRRLGAGGQAFPGLVAGIGPDRRAHVAWSARVRSGALQRLVTRVASGPLDGPLRTRLVARSAPSAIPSSVAGRRGPSVRLAFAPSGAVLAWQQPAGERWGIALRLLDHLDAPVEHALPSDAAVAVLDDLAVAPSGRPVPAWHTVDALGQPASGWVRFGDGPDRSVPVRAAHQLRVVFAPDGPVVLAVAREGLEERLLAFHRR